MVRTEEKVWAQSFQTKPRLSPAEAHQLVVLRQRVTELRYLSLEYLLRRAAHSDTKSERVAWESVWALTVFVEHGHRFPRQGELYPYLHKVLDESRTLEDLNLPPVDISLPPYGPQDAQKSVLETLTHDCTVFYDHIERAHAMLKNLLAKELVAAQASTPISSETRVEDLRKVLVFLDPS